MASGATRVIRLDGGQISIDELGGLDEVLGQGVGAGGPDHHFRHAVGQPRVGGDHVQGRHEHSRRVAILSRGHVGVAEQQSVAGDVRRDLDDRFQLSDRPSGSPAESRIPANSARRSYSSGLRAMTSAIRATARLKSPGGPQSVPH